MEFVDFRLYWEGHVNRSDLVTFFGISVPQASADLAQYQESAVGNVVYDKTEKTYKATKEFRAVFFKPSADKYLAQLRLLASDLLAKEKTWADQPPPFSVVPILRRRIEAKTLRSTIDAIRIGASLHVLYQSFSHADPTWRWVSPHALAFDGFRWHLRAWCHAHQDFRDFALPRVLEVGAKKSSHIDASRDAEWHQEVTLRIAPHPDLKEGQRAAIELDYGMVNGVLEFKTRASLFLYVECQLGLDLAPAQISAARQQIVLLNRAEIEQIRKEARATSERAIPLGS